MADDPAAQRTACRGFKCLPDSVICESILPRMPLKEAVRTSLLSREWRHRWKYMPCLQFSRDSFPASDAFDLGFLGNMFPGPGVFDLRHGPEVVKAIDRTLLLHVGPIREFILSYVIKGCPDVHPWISVVSRKGVKRIVLKFCVGRDRYRLPSCLFDCGDLLELQLANCLLWLPPMFKVFKDLTTLDLRYSFCTGDELGRLISSCPLLEDLTLVGNIGYDELKVCAPYLRRLMVEESVRHLILENMPLLQHARFHLFVEGDVGALDVNDKTSDFVGLLTPIPRIQDLVIGRTSLQLFSTGKIPKRLPTLLHHLKTLTLGINVRNLKHNMVAVCLFKSCPTLENLQISYSTIGEADVDDFWEANGGLNCSLDHLRIVVLAKVTDGGPEMAFAKFMLANMPVLRKLSIRLTKEVSKDARKFRVVTKDLLSFPRASKQARIILHD